MQENVKRREKYQTKVKKPIKSGSVQIYCDGKIYKTYKE